MFNQRGFTLIEILAVLIILSIIVAIAVPKIISMDKTAENTAIKVAIVELNSIELGCWTQFKMANDVVVSDAELFKTCNYTINNHEWMSLDQSGGILRFKESKVHLHRRHSANHEPARWSKETSAPFG